VSIVNFAEVFKNKKIVCKFYLHEEEKELEQSYPGKGFWWVLLRLKDIGLDLMYRLSTAQCLQLVRIKAEAKH
jgi:hypothetical protein